MSSSIRLSPPGKFRDGVFERADIVSTLSPEPSVYGSWDPTNKNGSTVLSGGDLIATGGPGGSPAMFHGMPILGSDYKYVWETYINGITRPAGLFTGIDLFDSGNGTNEFPGGSVGSHQEGLSTFGNTNVHHNGANFITDFPTMVATDTVMFAFDSATRQIWIGKNESWYGGGDPGAGTGEAVILPVGSYVVAGSMENGSEMTLNVGESAFDTQACTDLLSQDFRKVGTY